MNIDRKLVSCISRSLNYFIRLSISWVIIKLLLVLSIVTNLTLHLILYAFKTLYKISISTIPIYILLISLKLIRTSYRYYIVLIKKILIPRYKFF